MLLSGMKTKFPTFSNLSLEDKKDITEFTQKFNIYSDFSFINLFAWDIDNTTRISWINNNLVIQMTDYLAKDRRFFTLFGNNEIDETLTELFKITNHLELVPDFVIDAIKRPDIYAIAEDRSSFDYVYDIGELAGFAGKKYSKKRNHVNRAREVLGNRLDFTTVQEVSGSLMIELLDTFFRWEQETHESFPRTEIESLAFEKLLSNFSHFDLYITLSRVDGKLEGFSVHELLPNRQAICHFEKAINKSHDGLNTILINEAANFLTDKADIVNWEQDLGIEGLKRAKSSYHPIKHNRKYWIGSPSVV